MKLNSGILIMLMAIEGCVHDPLPPPCDAPVFEFNNVPPFGIMYAEDTVQYYHPVFNPSDPDEFICFKTVPGKAHYVLKYRISTGEIKVLGQANQNFALNWSKSGLLGLMDFSKGRPMLYDENYHFIKDYDFSPIRVGQPHFRNKKTEFYLMYFRPNGETFLKLYDTSFKLLRDTISVVKGYELYAFQSSENAGIWFTITNDNNKNENICYSMNDTVFGIQDKVYTIVHRKDGTDDVTRGFACTPDGETLYYSVGRSGIYRLTRSNPNPVLIKPTCGYKDYRYLSVSPDGSKLLVERDSQRADSTGSAFRTPLITHTSAISIMNIDGTGERKLLY